MKYLFALIIYRILLLLLLPIILVLLLIRSRKHKQYRLRIFERLGVLPPFLKPGGIVVHAASVGEVIALKAFVEQLLLAHPDIPITVTTLTPTGSAQVIKLFGDKVQHCYLPLDIFFCSRLFLNKLKPQVMVFMETELWPNIIEQASSDGTKLLLVNGRLSLHSMRNYQKITWLIKPVLNNFDRILVQSHENLANFISLGADVHRCIYTGNMKFDISLNNIVNEKIAELQRFLPSKRTIWLMASTHHGDEELALQAFVKIKAHYPEILLVLVPRHPERFDLIATLCIKQGFSLVKRSTQTQVNDKTQVWLLDSLGELMAAYALSDIVTIGGSFSNIGGHNPLEPALMKKPIITGPNMANFTEIMQQLIHVDGVKQLESIQPDALAQTVIELLTDKSMQQKLGANAYQVVIDNQGASSRSIQQLTTILQNKQVKNDKTYCQYDASIINDFNTDMLSADFWLAKGAVTGTAQGRGTTWFIVDKGQQWVLRHYYRGGLIGKLIKDSYFYYSQASTRAAKEFSLLSLMAQWQLPAPKPVAYRIIRQGLFYRADLLSSRIMRAKDLVAILNSQIISREVWFNVGATIKRFHDKGIYHHDLNAHNILLDDNNDIWLIDFDRCEIRPVDASWQQNNMQRLLRSFRKEQSKFPALHWNEEDWQNLMNGYNEMR